MRSLPHHILLRRPSPLLPQVKRFINIPLILLITKTAKKTGPHYWYSESIIAIQFVSSGSDELKTRKPHEAKAWCLKLQLQLLKGDMQFDARKSWTQERK